MDNSRPNSDLFLSVNDNWIIRLLLNILGYGVVFIPGFLIYTFVRKKKYLETSRKGWILNLLKICFQGAEPEIRESGREIAQAVSYTPHSAVREALLVLFCFLGLQSSYLIWGILQEKIMTQSYEDSNGKKEQFTDSQFLVFVNRILAFLLSGLYICLNSQTCHTAPLYKYAYCSFSNIMSSWCQYEALKYVSFPTQVLAKASKVIPVMIMGKLVSKAKYEYYEYVTAFLITIGMIFFMLGSSEYKVTSKTTFSGVVLLVLYLMFDSFTSNWQGKLFTQYKMSSIQMMCGVNLFSSILTGISLMQQGAFNNSIKFMIYFPKFVIDCCVLSICSTCGQLFVFFTISRFGPVVFIIIMTIRQGLAIVLSCLIYQHRISGMGIFGILVVFISIFLRVYCNQRLRAMRKKTQLTSSIKV